MNTEVVVGGMTTSVATGALNSARAGGYETGVGEKWVVGFVPCYQKRVVVVGSVVAGAGQQPAVVQAVAVAE